MKFNNFKAFEKHLEGSAPLHYSPLYLIISKDPFMGKTAVETTVKALVGTANHSKLGVKNFNEGRQSIEAILEELNTFTLFSEKRVICVNLAEKASTAWLKGFQDYFSNPTPKTYLIISSPSINHATNFYKQGEKIGIVLELAEEKVWEKEKNLAAWVANKVAARGKSIDSQSCQHLVKQIGIDFAILQNELEKLFCYIGDRQQITLSDIGAVCTSVNIENAWQLGEAVFRRDAAAALTISKALINEGTAFLALLRQLRHQVQTDYTVCSILANKGTKDDITQKFPYMKGFVLDRHVRSAQEYGMPRFKNAMLQIDAMEVMAKNGSLDQDLLTELLIIKLTK